VTDTDIRARPKSDGAVGHSGQKWTHRGERMKQHVGIT
jgi:hypothetical protein